MATLNTKLLKELRGLTEDDARVKLRAPNGKLLSRQYLWMIRADPPRRVMSLRMFARVVARLKLGAVNDPLKQHLKAIFPDEFKAPKPPIAED